MYKYNYNLRLKYNLCTQLFKIQAKLVIKYHQMIELNDMIGQNKKRSYCNNAKKVLLKVLTSRIYETCGDT